MSSANSISLDEKINQHLWWDNSTKKLEVTHYINNDAGKSSKLKSVVTTTNTAKNPNAVDDLATEIFNEFEITINSKNKTAITVFTYGEIAGSGACDIFPGPGLFYPLSGLPHSVVAKLVPNGGGGTTSITHGEAL